MPLLYGKLADKILSRYTWGTEAITRPSVDDPQTEERLEIVWGSSVWNQFAGKTVIDYGCGDGADSISILSKGRASRVIGVEPWEYFRLIGERKASRLGLSDQVTFTNSPNGHKADVILTLNSFEHFPDPSGVLDMMATHLYPGGYVLVNFGPPWKHPIGGHGFSTFTFVWSHLIVSEAALCRWRNQFSPKPIRRFAEMEEGLNQMTIAKFERIVRKSRFRIEDMELVPIRKLARFHNRLTREYFTSTVKCRLRLTEPLQ